MAQKGAVARTRAKTEFDPDKWIEVIKNGNEATMLRAETPSGGREEDGAREDETAGLQLLTAS